MYGKFLEAGVEIYEYREAMYHLKVLLVDGKWAVVGTSNFDNRSFGINDEICVAFPDMAITHRLALDFDADLMKSERMTLQAWNQRSLFERAHAQISRLIERQQ
jgi:cardiolipin synthase